MILSLIGISIGIYLYLKEDKTLGILVLIASAMFLIPSIEGFDGSSLENALKTSIISDQEKEVIKNFNRLPADGSMGDKTMLLKKLQEFKNIDERIKFYTDRLDDVKSRLERGKQNNRPYEINIFEILVDLFTQLKSASETSKNPTVASSVPSISQISGGASSLASASTEFGSETTKKILAAAEGGADKGCLVEKFAPF